MGKIKNFLINGRDLLSRPQSGVFSAAFAISSTYGISMLLGILRERLLVDRFYACCKEELDVYYAAFRLPDMIFQLVVIGALSAAFIPIFSEKLAKDKKEAYLLASSLINLLLVFFLVLAVFIFIFARPFSLLITGNFSFQQIDLMAQMTRLMLLAQIFFLISNLFSAMIQSHQRFLLPALSPAIYNIGIIISVVILSRPLGIWAATIGVLFGSFLHLLIQIPLVLKLGFKYSFGFNLKDLAVKKVVRLMLPRTLSLAVSQIEATISLFLATSLSPGSLTIYYLAQKLADLPVRLLGTSIGQAALPTLSLQLARNETDNFKRTINQSLGQIIYLSLPATAIFLILRVQLVRFAYGSRSFPWGATIMTGRTLAAIAFSVFSQSAIQLLVRGFYAVHDTTAPFIVSLLSVIVNVILSIVFIFSFDLGIFGLALGFSISNFLTFLLLLLFFNFKKEKFIFRSDFLNWLKMTFASVVAAFGAWGTMRVLDMFVFETSRVAPLLILSLISASVGLLIYIIISIIFGLKELIVVLKLIKKIGDWKKYLVPEKIAELYSEAGTGV